MSGHGTRVLGIAAGNGRASGGRYRGIASRSPLLVVKLGTLREDSFPRTTELMQGLDYCIRKASGASPARGRQHQPREYSYGAHAGTSLLETYIADVGPASGNRSSVSAREMRATPPGMQQGRCGLL